MLEGQQVLLQPLCSPWALLAVVNKGNIPESLLSETWDARDTWGHGHSLPTAATGSLWLYVDHRESLDQAGSSVPLSSTLYSDMSEASPTCSRP
jgi:hypothetical protein